MTTKDIHENHEPAPPLGLGSSKGLGAASEARCMCNDRALSACPGEWEPGCDLGNNPAHVRVSQRAPPYCPYCYDGDGGCAYPAYGVAPHYHDPMSEMMGSTRLLPRDQWPANFEPDPDDNGCGTYTHCMHCGAPNLNSRTTPVR